MISWNKVCYHKIFGELGLHKIRISIKFVGWDFIMRPKDMWVYIIPYKYKCGRDVIPNIVMDKAWSNFWMDLYGSWDDLIHDVTWWVRDMLMLVFGMTPKLLIPDSRCGVIRGRHINVSFCDDHWILISDSRCRW